MSRTADRPAQEKLLSRAVWQVLAEQGLDRLTIRAVAAAAGCTTSLVMHRFPNRRALLLHARHLLDERTRQRRTCRSSRYTKDALMASIVSATPTSSGRRTAGQPS